MTRVTILDYGSGNIRSVANLFSLVADSVEISNDEADIARATHIVLPGVGAFGAAMRKILERIPVELLRKMVLEDGKPFLGICVGMQVLAREGEEFGAHRGLGWIDGSVSCLNSGGQPLPHIGWNNVVPARATPLLTGLGSDADFYFVHSFVFRPADEQSVIATTSYGEEFCSVVQRANLFGVQFHPEKSQRAGFRLAKNFLAIS